MSEAFTTKEMGIFDLDELCGTAAEIEYEHIGGEVLWRDGRTIQARTLPAFSQVRLPHPYLSGRDIGMIVRRRSSSGAAVAYGCDMVALLNHDDERGWHVVGLLREQAYEETAGMISA